MAKSVPSSSSYRFARLSPGGVRHTPFGFLRKTFSWATSSMGGMTRSFLYGTNIVPPLNALRYRGGRYTPFPLYFKAFITCWMAVSGDMVTEFKSLFFTYLVGLMKRSRAPQRVRPSPMKARRGELRITDRVKAIAP